MSLNNKQTMLKFFIQIQFTFHMSKDLKVEKNKIKI